EPKTYNAAMRSTFAQQWRSAVDSEYQSLMTNRTWILVHPPKHRRVLQNRWVFVVKYTGSGEIDRTKARLSIKGFLQQYGVDYNEIYAPVIRMEVLRLLLTIAALLDFEIHQMDVKTAFLNGTLDDEIYMKQPEGFVVPGKEGLVCKLLKKPLRSKAGTPYLVSNIVRFSGKPWIPQTD
ncbi:Gag-pol Polyprotein, partial [Phytophthora megakarya]